MGSVRIFVAGASGVIGRELLPMLAGHDVVGMTRSRPELARELGAEPAVVDVYERDAVFAAVGAARPDVVVDLLTDLAGGDFPANNRIRREGTPNLVDAAVAAGARRIVVESISFGVPPDAAAARDEMERLARESGLETVIVHLARLWGPGTWNDAPGGDGEYVSVRDAARMVRNAILGASPGPDLR